MQKPKKKFSFRFFFNLELIFCNVGIFDDKRGKFKGKIYVILIKMKYSSKTTYYYIKLYKAYQFLIIYLY